MLECDICFKACKLTVALFFRKDVGRFAFDGKISKNLLGNLQKIRKLMNFQRRTIRLKIPEFLGGKPKGAETLGKKFRTISVYLARLSYQAGLLIMNFREMLFHSSLEIWKFISEVFIA